MPRPDLISRRWIIAALALVDAGAVAVALALAYWLRYESAVRLFPSTTAEHFAPVLLLLFAILCLAGLWAFGAYQRRNLFSGITEYSRIIGASGVWILVIIVGAYVRTHPYISRGFLVLAFILVSLLVCLGRFVSRRALYRAARNGRFLNRVVVVGPNRHGIAVAKQLTENPSASCEVVGFLSDYTPIGAEVSPGLRVLGEPMALEDVADAEGLTGAVVIESGLSWESLHGLIQLMDIRRDIEISLVPGLFDIHTTSMRAHQLGPVLTLVPQPARIVGFDAALKRTLDIVVGTVALVVSLPLILTLLLISSMNRGRWGLARDSIVSANGEAAYWYFTGPEWAVRLHLSRLPSLILVLTGKLSMLGPKPIPLRQQEAYAKAIPLLRSAKPGFIGPWWLVGSHRPDSLDDELAYDLHYLRNYTIWFDLHILIQAFRGLVSGSRRERTKRPERPTTEAPAGLVSADQPKS